MTPKRPRAPTTRAAGGARRPTQKPRLSSRLVGWASVGGVVVIALVSVTGKKPKASVPEGVPAAILDKVTHVPASVLDQVGIDGNPASTDSAANPVDVVERPIAALPTVAGKSTVFFFGAEWCPYCAAERWSLIVALSRFGTFSGLRGAASSPTDFAPDSQTFTFDGSSYVSSYVTFLPVEVENEEKAPLQNPTSAENKILDGWDAPLLFPFLDIGGRFVGGLPTWLSPTLFSGLSRSEIAGALWQPGNQEGSLLDANANYVTAAICATDRSRPAAVCDSSGVEAAAAQRRKLPAAVPIAAS